MKRTISITILALSLLLPGCSMFTGSGVPLGGGLALTTEPMSQEEVLAILDSVFRGSLRIGLRLDEQKALLAFEATREALMLVKAINKNPIPLSDLVSIADTQLRRLPDKKVAQIFGDIIFVAKPWLNRVAITRTATDSFLDKAFVDKMVDQGLVALTELLPKQPAMP